jgi:hypothetical protein
MINGRRQVGRDEDHNAVPEAAVSFRAMYRWPTPEGT